MTDWIKKRLPTLVKKKSSLKIVFAFAKVILNKTSAPTPTFPTSTAPTLWPVSDKHLTSPQNQNTRGNDQQLKKLLIVKQILFVSTLGNV